MSAFQSLSTLSFSFSVLQTGRMKRPIISDLFFQIVISFSVLLAASVFFSVPQERVRQPILADIRARLLPLPSPVQCFFDITDLNVDLSGLKISFVDLVLADIDIIVD